MHCRPDKPDPDSDTSRTTFALSCSTRVESSCTYVWMLVLPAIRNSMFPCDPILRARRSKPSLHEHGYATRGTNARKAPRAPREFDERSLHRYMFMRGGFHKRARERANSDVAIAAAWNGAYSWTCYTARCNGKSRWVLAAFVSIGQTFAVTDQQKNLDAAGKL